MKHSLPEEILELIDNYMNLSIGSFKINCPYFQNAKLKSFEAVNVGKGLPKEIEKKANILIADIKLQTKETIIKSMVDNHLGIDCSGLCMRVLDLLLKNKKGINIRQAIEPSKGGLINLIRHNFRTYTNLSADTLTSKLNCTPIQLNNVLPGDLIRAGKEHVGIIFEVIKTKDSVKRIRFVHSIDGGHNIGVNVGLINVVNSKLPIEKQKWKESGGKNYMLNEILSSDLIDSGIRRLKALL